jgi:hypothetical protein
MLLAGAAIVWSLRSDTPASPAKQVKTLPTPVMTAQAVDYLVNQSDGRALVGMHQRALGFAAAKTSADDCRQIQTRLDREEPMHQIVSYLVGVPDPLTGELLQRELTAFDLALKACAESSGDGPEQAELTTATSLVNANFQRLGVKY